MREQFTSAGLFIASGCSLINLNVTTLQVNWVIVCDTTSLPHEYKNITKKTISKLGCNPGRAKGTEMYQKFIWKYEGGSYHSLFSLLSSILSISFVSGSVGGGRWELGVRVLRIHYRQMITNLSPMSFFNQRWQWRVLIHSVGGKDGRSGKEIGGVVSVLLGSSPVI